MERLTVRGDHGVFMTEGFDFHIDPDDCDLVQEILDRLAAYEDTGLTPEEIKALKAYTDGKAVAMVTEIDGLPIDRVRELIQAEQDGRLVVLPCKAGDTVYVIDWYSDCEIDGYGVCDEYEENDEAACAFCHHNVVKKFVSERKFEKQKIADFGKTVFLTREEAEAALEREAKHG